MQQNPGRTKGGWLHSGARMQPTELNADLADADLSYFSAAQTSLRQTGIVVFRNLFNWIASLLDIVRKHAEQIVVSATTRVPLAFPPHFRWVAQTYACDLTALDPNTAGGNDEFCDTSLYRAIMTKLIERLLRAQITENGGYTLIRTRTILPKAEVTGALTLHMEKTAIRFPGVHVIWTPLTPPSIATNRDASGIEFCLRNDSI